MSSFKRRSPVPRSGPVRSVGLGTRRQRTHSHALSAKLSDARLSPGAGFEPADLAVTCPEGTPALRRRPTQSRCWSACEPGGGGHSALTRLSYAPSVGAAGFEPATSRLKDRRNPRLRSRPTRMSRSATTTEASMAARPRFERGPPGSEPGVVPVPPPRIGLDGRARTSNPRLPKPVRSRCATSRWYSRRESNPHWRGSRPRASAGWAT